MSNINVEHFIYICYSAIFLLYINSNIFFNIHNKCIITYIVMSVVWITKKINLMSRLFLVNQKHT